MSTSQPEPVALGVAADHHAAADANTTDQGFLDHSDNGGQRRLPVGDEAMSMDVGEGEQRALNVDDTLRGKGLDGTGDAPAVQARIDVAAPAPAIEAPKIITTAPLAAAEAGKADAGAEPAAQTRKRKDVSVDEDAADALSRHLVRLIASQRSPALRGDNQTTMSSTQRPRWQSIIAENLRTARRTTALERCPRYAEHGASVAGSGLDKGVGRASVLDNDLVRRKLMGHIRRKRKLMAAKVSGLRGAYRLYNRQWRAHCERLDRIGEGNDGPRRIVSFGGSGSGTPMQSLSFQQTERSAEDGGNRTDVPNSGTFARSMLVDNSGAASLLGDDIPDDRQQQSLTTAYTNTTSATASMHPSAQTTSFDDVPSAGGLLASATAAAMTRANRRNTQGSGGLAGFGDAVRSEAEFLEILATLESADMQDPSMRAARTTAVEPDMILSAPLEQQKPAFDHHYGRRIESIKRASGGDGQWCDNDRARVAANRRRTGDFAGQVTSKRSYDDDNGFVADPSAFYLSDFDPDVWSEEEKATFARRYALFPKQFGKIATSLPNKTARQCVSYYYLTKKLYGHDYKTLLASRNRDRRRKTKMVKPKKGRGSALMADLKAAAPAEEDVATAAGDEVAEAPAERPRSRVTVGEEEAAETPPTEKPRNRQSTSSYWSVAERNDFLRSLAVFGKEWDAIALTLSSKSAAQARNYFSRNARDPDFVDAFELARKNEGRSLDERREAAERLFQRLTKADEHKRSEHAGKARARMPLDGRGPTMTAMHQLAQAASADTGTSGSPEVMRGLDISSLLNADPDSNAGSNSMRRASKQVYWFDRFLTSEQQGAPSDSVTEQQQRSSMMPSSSSSTSPAPLPPLVPPPPPSLP